MVCELILAVVVENDDDKDDEELRTDTVRSLLIVLSIISSIWRSEGDPLTVVDTAVVVIIDATVFGPTSILL